MLHFIGIQTGGCYDTIQNIKHLIVKSIGLILLYEGEKMNSSILLIFSYLLS